MLEELIRAGLGAAGARATFGGRPPAVIHSFSGPLDYAHGALDLGLAISISGLAFRAGEEATADVVRIVPAKRLIVETDSPYLTPPGGPKRRNEPAAVAITTAWAAEQRGASAGVGEDALVAAYDAAFPRLTAPASRT